MFMSVRAPNDQPALASGWLQPLRPLPRAPLAASVSSHFWLCPPSSHTLSLALAAAVQQPLLALALGGAALHAMPRVSRPVPHKPCELNPMDVVWMHRQSLRFACRCGSTPRTPAIDDTPTTYRAPPIVRTSITEPPHALAQPSLSSWTSRATFQILTPRI